MRTVQDFQDTTLVRWRRSERYRFMNNFIEERRGDPTIPLLKDRFHGGENLFTTLSGLGGKKDNRSVGHEVQIGAQFLEENPIESFAPGLAIFITVLAVNLLGDGLREALDPKLRGR